MTTVAATAVRIREAAGAELEQWDELVRRFANHRVCHTRGWVRSLEACGDGTPLYLLFEKDGDVVACLPGLLQTVGPLRLFCSPRSGWQTVSMGPAFDAERITTAELLGVLVPHLEQRHRVSHIELMHTGLDAGAMRAAGFEGEPVFTYRAPMFPGDEARTLKRMKDSARRNVTRAQRLGLEVRIESDPRWVDEHYDQVHEVYVRGGNSMSFTRQRMVECFRHMQSAGNLVAVSVYLPGGRVNIATGMFLIEGTELSLWMWAHRTRYRWYRPTELMTWTVMQRAMAQGCDTFDLMGGGEFKTKLGAEADRTKWRWIRSQPRWLAGARHVAEVGYRCQQKVRGRLARAGASAAGVFARGEDGSRARLPACVMGDVDLVRSLGLAGISSVVVAPPGDAARFSRHARAALEWMDPWDRGEALVGALVAHGQAQPEPPVLFYDADATLLLVSRHRDTLRRAFRFVVAEPALVEALVDKAKFQELASRLRLPVPPARALRPGPDLDAEALDLPFPAIVKPVTRRPRLWHPIAGGSKALRLASPEELRALWPRLRDVPVIIQSLVPGDERAIESYHVYLDARGAVVAEFTGRKVRTLPAEFGDSTALEISDAPDVLGLGRDIVQRLALRGVAKLDFKRGPDGALHLLEINPRFTLWHHLGAKAGVNIPALVYGDLVGLSRPDVLRAREGVRWCKPWTDHAAARARGMSWLRWLPWALTCEAKRAFAPDDPLPLLRAALSQWGRFA